MDASLKEVVLDKARQMKESMEEKLGKPLTKPQMQKLLQKVYEVEKKKSGVQLAGGRRKASKPMEHSDDDEEESESEEETEEDRDFIVESDGEDDDDDAPLKRKGKYICQYTNKSFATKAEYIKHLHKLVHNMEERIARGVQAQQPVGGLRTALTYVKIELRHLTK